MGSGISSLPGASGPRLAVTPADLALASGTLTSKLSVTPSKEVQFGDTPVQSTKTKNITINNSGTKPLSVDKLVLAEFGELKHFSMVANSCDAPLPPRRSCRLELLFNPKTPGEKVAKLRIHTNAAPESFLLSIRGSGK